MDTATLCNRRGGGRVTKIFMKILLWRRWGFPQNYVVNEPSLRGEYVDAHKLNVASFHSKSRVLPIVNINVPYTIGWPDGF